MTDSHYAFGLREELKISLEHIGNEREPVLIVAGVLTEPESLIDYACNQVAFKPAWGPKGGYPGIRSPAPLNYVNQLVRALDPAVRRAFQLERVKLARAECNFSIVTLSPEQLSPNQRVPHVDTVDPLQFAFLHYLCGPEHGGTSFYRHRSTGFETLTAERQAPYDEARRSERRGNGTPPGYIGSDTDFFVQTATFESCFDRLIIYRSRTLHSGQIPRASRLDANPRTGRLTANIFVNYSPA